MKFYIGLILQLSVITTLLVNCNTAEHQSQLKQENDSLRLQIEINHKAIQALKEVSLLMDSIDAAQNVLRIELVGGTSYEHYIERLKEILEYVRKTEKKIDTLNTIVGTVNNENSAYIMLIDALQGELGAIIRDVDILQKQVKKVNKKNSELITLVKLQQAELEENEIKLHASREELSLFENRIHELMIKSKVSEADAYYARAEAVYEAARRTKLAPRKKKETLREALELYKKAFALGKEEAQMKIKDLEKRV